MDESSLKLDDPDNKKFTENNALVRQMTQTKVLAKIKARDYQIIHFAGGHGAMWDFNTSEAINHLVRQIYEKGAIVSAICHGPAALVNVKLSNGDYLVKGKEVSAFTNAEEEEVKMTKVVPFSLETTLRERGAKMVTAQNWQDQSVVSERLVTGQNPQSGHSVAKKILALAQSLKSKGK
jgi:putative intracellular protease/amidase